MSKDENRRRLLENDIVMNLILKELSYAETDHPDWPCDPIHGAAIVAEEAGELVQASLQYIYEQKPKSRMIVEAIHTAVTAFRFIKNGSE